MSTTFTRKHPARTATPKQVDFLLKLAEEIGRLDPQSPGLSREEVEACTPKEASDTIDALLKAVKYLRENAVSHLKEGLYRKDGTVYQVRRSRASGRLYALKIAEGSTEYVGFSPLAGLTEDMLLSSEEAVEIARAYGQSTGICYVCGRRLSTAQSIEQGIGPVCRSRM